MRRAAGSFPFAVGTGLGSLWVVLHDGPTVLRLDPPTGRVVAAFGSVWVAISGNGSVTRIDAKSDRVVRDIPRLGPSNSTDVAAAGNSIWVSDYVDGAPAVDRIGPHRRRSATSLDSGRSRSSASHPAGCWCGWRRRMASRG